MKLTGSEQENLNTFMNNVRKALHPREATGAWDSNYKQFGNTKIRQPQIRLSRTTRTTFQVDDKAQTVSFIQVGGDI